MRKIQSLNISDSYDFVIEKNMLHHVLINEILEHIGDVQNFKTRWKINYSGIAL